MNRKRNWKFQNLKNSFSTLCRFLEIQSPSDLERIGVIKAFEFTFDLCWKVLKAQAETEGIFVASPKKRTKICISIWNNYQPKYLA